MEGPRLTGFRQDARPYEVTATAAFQDIRRPNVIELKDMRARLAIDAAGAMATLVSQAGVFDTTKEHLELKNEIRISTDKGEEALLKTAAIDFKAGTVVSHDPVRVTTPQLVLEAGGFELSDGGATMAFTGRVRTQLLPGPGRGPASPAAPAAKLMQAEAGERR
jgi:lipopolysaccharide export system protein LptC